jgi:hypothetical protein
MITDVTSPEILDAMTARAIAAGYGFVGEITNAVRQGRVNALFVQPSAPAPMARLKRSQRPTIVVVGDDPGTDGFGPDGWVATKKLLRWTDYAVLHAAGGSVETYRKIVTLTVHWRRLLLIESSTAREAEWARALLNARPKPVPFLAILATDGAHPTREAA